MVHTRVFVTYLPTACGGAMPRRRRGAEPKVAAVATALLLGGAVPVHSGPAARESAAPLPQPATASTRPAPALLVLTTSSPAEPPVTLPQAAPPREGTRAKPPAPRRDVAGFLAQQGYVLAQTTPPLKDAALAPVLSIAEPEPVAVAPPEDAIPTAAVEPVAADAAVQSYPHISVDGQVLGSVTMRGDTIHLASLLGLFALKLPPDDYARLKDAPASDSFVPLASLQAAGIAVAVDAATETITLTLS